MTVTFSRVSLIQPFLDQQDRFVPMAAAALKFDEGRLIALPLFQQHKTGTGAGQRLTAIFFDDMTGEVDMSAGAAGAEIVLTIDQQAVNVQFDAGKALTKAISQLPVGRRKPFFQHTGCRQQKGATAGTGDDNPLLMLAP